MNTIIFDLTQVIIEGEKITEQPIQFALSEFAYARPKEFLVGQIIDKIKHVHVTTVVLKTGSTTFSVKEPIAEWGNHILTWPQDND